MNKPDGNSLLYTDAEFIITDCNRHALRLFHKKAKQVIGHPAQTLLEELIDANHIENLIKHADKDYSIFASQYQISVTKLPETGASQYLFIVTDTLPFTRNVHSLAEDYLANVIHNSPGYLYLKDRQSRYIISNENFARAAGLSSAEAIVGKTDFDLAWGKTEAELFRQGDQEALKGIEKINFEEPQRQADGHTATVLANKVPLYDKDRNVIGILGNFFDITERKQQEQILIETREAAQAANIAKSRFIASMSHDLRTPLVGIVGVSEILRRQISDQEQLELLGDLHKASETILNFVNEILDYSRLESGQLEIKNKEFNLLDMADNIASSLAGQLQNKHNRLLVCYNSDDTRIIKTDEAALRRIIINLLGNSAKFTEKGNIFLRLSTSKANKQGSFLTLEVEDTGIGIPPDKLEHIFERFYRVDPSYHGRYRGTGLGLSIVKELVDRLGGQIEVKSEVNQGTTITCNIPVGIVEAKKFELDKSLAKNTRILIISDDQKLAHEICGQLDFPHSQSSSYQTAKQAITDAKKPYNFLLFDYQGNLNTLKELLELAGQQQKGPVYCSLLSSPLEQDELTRVKAVGLSTIISYPITPFTLNSRIISYLAKEQNLSLQTTHLPEVAQSTQEKRKVLLVEDDSIAMKITKNLLELIGCEVTCAQNGKEALEHATQAYDLILMDIGLPDMNGTEVTKKLKANAENKNTPIVALTGHDAISMHEEVFSGHVHKPAKLEDLTTILEELT